MARKVNETVQTSEACSIDLAKRSCLLLFKLIPGTLLLFSHSLIATMQSEDRLQSMWSGRLPQEENK